MRRRDERRSTSWRAVVVSADEVCSFMVLLSHAFFDASGTAYSAFSDGRNKTRAGATPIAHPRHLGAYDDEPQPARRERRNLLAESVKQYRANVTSSEDVRVISTLNCPLEQRRGRRLSRWTRRSVASHGKRRR